MEPEPEEFHEPEPEPEPEPERRPSTGGGYWLIGERLQWISALVLMLSPFMGWYGGSGDGIAIAVTGWNTGMLGKLVFFVGLAVLALFWLRRAGIETPPSVPESLIVVALGSLATVFVLIRLISIPDTFLPADGRGIGIWIALLSSIGVIAAGLLQAADEL